MKIAYLSASIIPSKNANSVHVMKMCQAFAKNGCNVTLYARKTTERVGNIYEHYGVENCFDIKQLGWPSIRGLGGWLYGKKVKKQIKNDEIPDVFYGRDIYSLLEVTSINKSLIYYEAHKPPSNKVQTFMESQLFSKPNFKRLIVISNALRKKYLSLFPKLRNDQVIVAHDGADIPKSLDISEEDKLSVTNIKVGYIGHLYPGKGMEVIVQLATRLPTIEFHVVGGKKEDIEYWKEQIDKPNIIFHGFIPHGSLYKYYAQFNVVLAPYQTKVSSSGGKDDISKWMSPLKIFEYMANGKAIIASDLPVLREVLHEGNSLLCPPEDVDVWEKSLVMLVNNKQMLRELGDNARVDFVKYYTWSQRGMNVLA